MAHITIHDDNGNVRTITSNDLLYDEHEIRDVFMEWCETCGTLVLREHLSHDKRCKRCELRYNKPFTKRELLDMLEPYHDDDKFLILVNTERYDNGTYAFVPTECYKEFGHNKYFINTTVMSNEI